MADHNREQVMDAVTTIVTGLATTGANVFRARVFPQDQANLPALLVYQGEDEPILDTESQQYDFIDSVLSVIIEAWVNASSGNIDETMNLINKEVIIALQADRTQGLGFVIDTDEGVVSAPELLDEGNKRTGFMTMEFFIKYRRQRTDPSVL